MPEHTPERPVAELDASHVTRVLDQQHEDLRGILAISTRQRDCLAREDLEGVEAASGRMHGLMRRIQLRQSELPANLARITDAAVTERVRDMQDTIRRAMQMRQTNEHSVRQLMTRSQSEIRHFRQGRQASQGYQYRRVGGAPRFYDGLR